MNYINKIEAAKSSVKDYYTAVLPDRPADIPGDVQYNKELDAIDKACLFADSIKKLGAISEEGLSLLSHEDILSVLPVIQGTTTLPKVLAKQIAGIFRANSGGNETSPYVSTRRAELMSFAELIANYDPLEANAVSNRLNNISQKKGFIVFSQSGEVDISNSLALLDEVRMGYEARSVYNGARVCKVGEVDRVRMVDENPLFPGKPLRHDGTCDITNRSWGDIDHKTRVLASLISLNSEESRAAGMTANGILDIIYSASDTFTTLGKRFPLSLAKFNRLSHEGKLPSLKVSLQPFTNKPLNLFQGKKVA